MFREIWILGKGKILGGTRRKPEEPQDWRTGLPGSSWKSSEDCGPLLRVMFFNM